MGEPALPNVPPAWLASCNIKMLPSEPDMEADCAIWIEALAAWVAEDEDHLEYLREALGPEAKILLPSELPPTP